MPRNALIALALALLAAPSSGQDNLLILVADDLGVDRVGAYREHPDPGRTPNLDRLAAEGVLFRNAWAAPVCSPSRACALTGRFGFRTGIGHTIKSGGGAPLNTDELILPELLAVAPRPYSNAALGKWHLAEGTLAHTHPQDSGFSVFAGSKASVGDYFHWYKIINGIGSSVDAYATTDTVDDAIRAVRALPEPWVLWVAFSAPHKPFHAPPRHLHSFPLSGDPKATPVEHMKAMTEAMDAEIGRLLASVPLGVAERTTTIFFGDNGTVAEATTPPFASHKGSILEGGINVPLIIAGSRVRRPDECAALVSITDIFATAAEIAGVDPHSVLPPGVPIDSVSLLPYLEEPATPSIREWAYAEFFAPNGPVPRLFHQRALRGARYKLIRYEQAGPIGGTPTIRHELYDLELDPFEATDLLQQGLSPQESRAYQRLSLQMRGLVSS